MKTTTSIVGNEMGFGSYTVRVYELESLTLLETRTFHVQGWGDRHVTKAYAKACRYAKENTNEGC